MDYPRHDQNAEEWPSTRSNPASPRGQGQQQVYYPAGFHSGNQPQSNQQFMYQPNQAYFPPGQSQNFPPPQIFIQGGYMVPQGIPSPELAPQTFDSYGRQNDPYLPREEQWSHSEVLDEKHVDNLDQADYENLEEIEREFLRAESTQNGSNDIEPGQEEYTGPLDLSDDDALRMAELDEMVGETSPRGRYDEDITTGQENSVIRQASPRLQSSTSGAVLPIGATPEQNGVLSPHAAEFWFPESRDCPCCNGFRHHCKGCGAVTCTACLKQGVALTSSQNSSVESKAPVAAAAAAPAVRASSAPAAVQKTAAASLPAAPIPVTSYSPRVTSSPYSPGVSAGRVCTFFLRGMCRNGASCAFEHSSAAAAAPDPQARQPCHFFMQGNCTFGASCRNSHDMGAGGASGQGGAALPQAPARTAAPSRGPSLPPGAVPSQNGVLTAQAAEFWFPESRNCSCCQGYKHGCQCCKSGVTSCVACA